MKYFDRAHRATTLKVIVGSAFVWAWLDGIFMGSFFQPARAVDTIPSVAAILIFTFSGLGFAFPLWKASFFERILSSKKALLFCSIAGSSGSLLCVLGGYLQNWPLIIVASILCGMFLTIFVLGWGASYSHEGGHSAAPLVAGAFACALVLDIPPLLMVPQASALFFAFFPLASGLFLMSLNPAQRRYRSRQQTALPTSRGARSHLRRYLGISILLLGALSLVMIGFGYMQHLMSLSPPVGTGNTGSILIIIVRGISALLLFAALFIAPKRIGLAYRIGLLVMIAGFMVMPFFAGDLFWISGALVIGGYTAFDILIWVVFSQIAYEQSQAPLKTISAMRLIMSPCHVAGTLIAVLFASPGADSQTFSMAATTFVGYSVVIATVLLLSSEDTWMSFRDSPIQIAIAPNEEELDQAAYAEKRLVEAGLTPREKDIALLLARGRTQPWIAEFFTISENTVSTHVRHVYQKTGVHNRQELIDVVFPKH